LPTTDIISAEMSIEGLPPITMVDDDNIAITPVVPSSVYHHTIIGCINSITQVTININSVVVRSRRVIKTGNEVVVRRPDKNPNPYGPICDSATCPRAKYLGDARIIARDNRCAPGNELQG
jgi:hypothetical protein